MGIDFSHGNAHWSYSGFHSFRCRLAQAVGLDLNEMEGFEKLDFSSCPNSKTLVTGKSWDTVKDDLKLLLYHSDCDGFLSVEDCRKLIPRLKDMLFKIDFDYDKRMCLELIQEWNRQLKRKSSLNSADGGLKQLF